MCILDKGVVVQNLESRDAARSRGALRSRHRSPHGGAGHGADRIEVSTTLLAAVNVLNDGRAPSTIEDPVVSRIVGVKQMQSPPRPESPSRPASIDAPARARRNHGRRDPRPRDGAHLAVEAALTGHLVLSTLHTRDALSARSRLIEMGIEPFLVSSSVDCVSRSAPGSRCSCPHRQAAGEPAGVGLEEDGLAGIQPMSRPLAARAVAVRLSRARLSLMKVMTVSEGIRCSDPGARLGR